MGAQATRLSDVKVKAAKPKEKDYILTDGDGLQMRVGPQVLGLCVGVFFGCAMVLR